MVQQTPRKHVFVSGVHASSKSDDGETVIITMGNSVDVTHANGISVRQITIPNVFPNINRYRSEWIVDTVSYFTPLNQYTATTLAAQMTTHVANVIHAYDTTTHIWSITNNTGVDVVLSYTSEQWDLLGYHWRGAGFTLNGDRYDVTVTAAGIGQTLTGLYVPALGGEQFVSVACRQIAHSNLVHGSDGIQYDILCAVPLSDTPFLSVKSFITPDDNYASVNFPNATALDQSLELHILDSRMRRLAFPLNHHIDLFFCAHHNLGT